MNRNIQKALSVLIAMTLWFYVLSSESSKEVKLMKMQYVLPNGLSFKSSPPKEIKVNFSGPKAFLRTYLEANDSILIDINLEKKRKGLKYFINLTESYLSLPLGVSIEKFEFNKLSLNLEESVTKNVSIDLNLVGNPSGNNSLVSKELSQSKVKVSGAKSILNKVKNLQTRPIDISKLTGEGEEEIGFIVDESLFKFENETPILFKYKIIPNEINYTLNNIPIRFLSSKIIARSSENNASLLVHVEDENMRLVNSDVQIIAEIPDDAQGKVNVKLKADVKNGVHIIKVNPSTITVWVK